MVLPSTSHVNTQEPLLIDETEVGELLGISKSTVRRWVAADVLHPVDLPHCTRRLYRLDDVRALVNSLEAR